MYYINSLNMIRPYRIGFILLLLSSAGLHKASAQALEAYIEAPGDQSTSLTSADGVLTETFDSLPLGDQTTPYVSAIGTYQFSSTAQGDIVAADQYGGANGSQYLAFGAESGTSAPITINLNGNYNYFGFWFSAGDANNGVTFYSNGTEFARFSTATILTLLNQGSTVTSLNGTTYLSSAYFGNPNGTNEDTGEPFAYVEIVTVGTTFNTVVLDNSGSTGTGFESDNDSVAVGDITLPSTDVMVTGLAVVPEPAHYAILLAGLLFCLVGGQRMIQRFQVALAV